MILRKILRVKYSKTGMMRFIGHLDITRLMTRAIARSEIPVLYSQGFSPHMKLSFGPALPLGFTSDCEFLDVVINEAEALGSAEQWMQELQKYLPEGIFVLKMALLDDNAPSLAQSIDRACYEVTIPEQFALQNGKLARFLQMEKIEVEKSSKQGTTTVDIRPSVVSLNRIDNIGDAAKIAVYELVIAISQAAYATPPLVLNFLLGCDWREVHGLRIHRKDLFSAKGGL